MKVILCNKITYKAQRSNRYSEIDEGAGGIAGRWDLHFGTRFIGQMVRWHDNRYCLPKGVHPDIESMADRDEYDRIVLKESDVVFVRGKDD